MCREMELVYSKGIEVGKKIGEKRGFKNDRLDHAKETVLSMVKDGIGIEKVAYYVNVTTEKVQKWLNESLSTVN